MTQVISLGEVAAVKLDLKFFPAWLLHYPHQLIQVIDGNTDTTKVDVVLSCLFREQGRLGGQSRRQVYDAGVMTSFGYLGATRGRLHRSRTLSPMRTCSDCGKELSDLTQPCPTCRSSSQNVSAYAGVAIGLAAAIGPGVSLTFSSDQPWYAKWHKVKQSLATVETACHPSSYQGNDPVKRAVESFFVDCFHMGDWLWEDSSTGLNKPQVCTFIENDPSLRVCEGFANTDKHRVRSKSGAITAKIRSITSGPNGVQVSIEWMQGANTHTEDALDLARRCVAAWEACLLANGLQSPI
jgi:hypothetical protein